MAIGLVEVPERPSIAPEPGDQPEDHLALGEVETGGVQSSIRVDGLASEMLATTQLAQLVRIARARRRRAQGHRLLVVGDRCRVRLLGPPRRRNRVVRPTAIHRTGEQIRRGRRSSTAWRRRTNGR